MSRVQLSLNVTDFDAAVAFYSRMFGTAPAKLRPGYANFAIADPPLKLVLNSPGNGPGGTINHLGVEVDSTDEVNSAGARMAADGLDTERRARHGVLLRRCRTRCGRTTRTGCPGSTTPSWNTSRRHDPRAAAASRLAAGSPAPRARDGGMAPPGPARPGSVLAHPRLARRRGRVAIARP